MSLLTGRFQRSTARPPVRPASWARRHPVLLAIPVVVALVVVGGIVGPPLWNRCGDGLTSVDGSPWTCVGLNIDSGPMRRDDPLVDLEKTIATHNAQVTGDFRTIVMLENLTVNPEKDSNPASFVRHEVQGAITAAYRTDSPTRVRLLLANFGSNADHWREAVDAIFDAVASQHIIAVTDVGLSQENSRAAVAELSRRGIPTIGSTVTSDDMNLGLDNVRSKNFFRVGSTNTDEARVAANHIARAGFQRVMLVMDTSPEDSYSATLARAFQGQAKIALTKKYDYPSPPGIPRDKYMGRVFAGMHADVCNGRPDVIYFAGRGADLESFLASLANEGACDLTKVTVMTGDDASTLTGKPIRDNGDIHFIVLYTALAHPEQWQPQVNGDPPRTNEAVNYSAFLTRFTGTFAFSPEDLGDGAAMMEHDAVAAAVRGVSRDPSAQPSSLVNFLVGINCADPVPGASGYVVFDDNGNQFNKAVPIVRVSSGGALAVAALDWPRGRPKGEGPC